MHYLLNCLVIRTYSIQITFKGRGRAMEKLTKRLTVVLIGCIILLLGACAGTGTEEDGDNGDKPVTLYSPHTPEFSEELAEKFKELHGKSVDVHYAGTNVLVNQMVA